LTSDGKKVLVTGGLGFIGSNLTRELERRGHEVWVCDLLHPCKANYIRCDAGKFRQVERLFEEHDFDIVYHAAAEYGRWNGEDYYENLWLTNVVDTKNVLRIQEKRKFRMVFFGSTEVYGDYGSVMTEDVTDKVPIKQMNDYAISKWVNELQIMNSAAMFKTEAVRVRLFNVYGPRATQFPLVVVSSAYHETEPLAAYTDAEDKILTVNRLTRIKDRDTPTMCESLLIICSHLPN
jgi:dTDP-glucose 4,6-dehydratase